MTDARRRQRAPRRALKRHPSPAKCEIVHRRPMPDNAPVSLSDPFGPLRGRRDGSARDRPRSAHQRRERRWADAHVARKDLSRARWDARRTDARHARRAPLPSRMPSENREALGFRKA